MKRKKSQKTKELKKKDKLFSLSIRQRDGKCVMCGSHKTNQAAHIFSKKANPHLRHDLDNAITLCYACHFFKCHHSPVEFTFWVIRYLGHKKFKQLYFKSLFKE